MARGDFFKVTYRTGAGTDDSIIAAHGVGHNVDAAGFEGRAEFITVTVFDRTNQPVEVARFARSEVVAVVQGHQTMTRTRAKK
jgi:hypothetical protein